MTTDAVFDFENLLALGGMRDTQVFRGNSTAIYPDGTVDLRYEGLPLGALHQATEWLVANRVILTDAVVAGVPLDGVWRTVAIQEQLVTEGGRKNGTVLVQRLAKGLYDTLDWTVCRVAQGTWSHGNTTSADSTANTTSYTYQRWSTVRMPYVRPDKAKELADGLTDTTYTDLVVGGIKHDGVWLHLGAKWQLEEDQTASVLVTLAQPVFTTQGYRNYGTYEREDRYLVANVPAQNIQSILDAWKMGRKGADGVIESYHTDRNTANLILSVPVTTAKTGQRVRTTEDAFKTVVATTDINGAAAGTLPAAVVGKIYSTDTEETGLGKHNVTQTVDTAKTGETPEHVVAKLSDGTTIKSHSARHLVSESLPAWAVEPASAVEGTATRITRQADDYGGVSVDRQDRVVTQVRRPTTAGTTYTYERDQGDVHIVEYDGVTPALLPAILNEFGTAPTDYEATHNISASPEFDAATGTFSVRLMAVPKGGGSGGGGSKACEIIWTEAEVEEDRSYDKANDTLIVYRRTLDYACGRKQNTSETAIQSFITTAKAFAGTEEFVAQTGPLGRWGFWAHYKYVTTRGSWSKFA